MRDFRAKDRDEDDAGSQKLLTDTQKLLNQLQIRKEELDSAGIDSKDLERAMSPSFWGKGLRLLVSVSVTRTLMLWPFMLRKHIKLNKEVMSEIRQVVDIPSQEDSFSPSILSTNSEKNRLSITRINPGEEAQSRNPVEAGDKVLLEEEDDDAILASENKHTEIITTSVGKESNTIPPQHQKKGSMLLLTTSALLLESKESLRGIAGVSAFHETTETLISSIWSAFLSSLILNGLANYFLYPKERGANDLFNIFGLMA